VPNPTGGQFLEPFNNGNIVRAPSTDVFSLPALKVDWDFGAARLLSNTSYYVRHQSAVSDYTNFALAVLAGNPYPPAGSMSPNFWSDNQKNFTQEIRIESRGTDRVNWVAGLFYQRAWENTTENVYAPQLPVDFDTENGLPPGSFLQIFGPTPQRVHLPAGSVSRHRQATRCLRPGGREVDGCTEIDAGPAGFPLDF